MRSARPILSGILATTGVLIAVAPAVSVWRAGGRALAELPTLIATADDTRHPLAFRDPSFVLATRALSATSATELEAALRQDGFRPTEGRGGRWLSKECCGENDAVWVRVEDGPGHSAVATVTVADDDTRSSWPLFAGVGTGLVVGGAATARPRRRPRAGDQLRAAATTVATGAGRVA